MDKSLWPEAAKRYWTKQGSQAVDDHTILNDMETDPDFKKYILDHKNVFDVLEYVVEQDLKDKIKSWRGQNGNVVQISNPRRHWKTFIARAAGIALIIVASLYFWPVNRHDQALENYQPLIEEVERGGAKNETVIDFYQIFIEGEELLQDKKYNEALDKMRSVIQANPDQHIVQVAEWNILVLLKTIDPKGEEYRELYMKIKDNESHHHHSWLKRLRKWGI